MTIGREELGTLMGRLVSASPRERDEASSTVRDWAQSLDDFERQPLIRVLALVASVEHDPTARESELDPTATRECGRVRPRVWEAAERTARRMSRDDIFSSPFAAADFEDGDDHE